MQGHSARCKVQDQAKETAGSDDTRCGTVGIVKSACASSSICSLFSYRIRQSAGPRRLQGHMQQQCRACQDVPTGRRAWPCKRHGDFRQCSNVHLNLSTRAHKCWSCDKSHHAFGQALRTDSLGRTDALPFPTSSSWCCATQTDSVNWTLQGKDAL